MAKDVQNKKSTISIWKFIIRKWFIIVIALALFLGATTVYSFIKIKPTYTAQTSIVLKMAISDTVNASTNTNNATLAKKNLPTVKECLISPMVASAANEYYNAKHGVSGNNVSKSSIRVNYGESSMIFVLGYTDSSKEAALLKLEAVIATAPSVMEGKIEAESVDLVPVQNVYNTYVSDGKASTIMAGGIAGLVVGICIVLLIYIFDNKIRNKEELEEITGASVIALIKNDSK